MSADRLIVTISGRRMEIDLEAVVEIADRGTVTLLPQLPPAMPGVVSVRGSAVPVVDAGVLSGDPPRHDHRSILVATDSRRRVALLIDGVEWIDAGSAGAQEDLPAIDVGRLFEEIR